MDYYIVGELSPFRYGFLWLKSTGRLWLTFWREQIVINAILVALTYIVESVRHHDSAKETAITAVIVLVAVSVVFFLVCGLRATWEMHNRRVGDDPILAARILAFDIDKFLFAIGPKPRIERTSTMNSRDYIGANIEAQNPWRKSIEDGYRRSFNERLRQLRKTLRTNLVDTSCIDKLIDLNAIEDNPASVNGNRVPLLPRALLSLASDLEIGRLKSLEP